MINNDKFSQQAKDIISKLTLDEKVLMLSTHQYAVERLGLKEFHIGTEVARGYVGREKEKYSTVFPQPIGLAATFDRKLLYSLGEIAGNEARAYYNITTDGGLCLWGPTVDMVRDPRWGRTEEAYGEDVFLTGELTAQYTKAMAGDGDKYYKTIPTLKHFCANNNEENRINCNAYLPLRLKYEYYYAAFENPIRHGGAKSIMAAYNEINGVPCILNPELKSVLKDKWGLWFAVSDGGDFSQTVLNHKYFDSHALALAESIKAGCDIMTDDAMLVKKSAEVALAQGILTEEMLDETLANTIYARLRLGQLDDSCPYNSITTDIVDNEQSRDINLKATLEQVCLLKNNSLLPLKTAPKKICVVGCMHNQNLKDWYTGFSREETSILQGIKNEYADCEISADSLWDYVSIKGSNGKYLSAKDNGDVVFDSHKVTASELFELQDWGENWCNLFSIKYDKYVRLCDNGNLKLHNCFIYDWFTRETFNLIKWQDKFLLEEFLDTKRIHIDADGHTVLSPTKEVKNSCLFDINIESSGEKRGEMLAKSNDIVIYCVGNHPVQTAKECYDRKTIELNIQPKMAIKLHNNNPNTIMVISSSYPYSVVEENDKLSAIMWTSHAGMFLGDAVAKTISGKNNPSGHLPLTWYKSELELPSIMTYDIASAKSTYMYFEGTPLYPFGYGLSYSDFEYSNLSISKSADGYTASLQVTNASEFDGDEVVQIYFNMKNSSVKRPNKKLCGFTRISLMAGETKCAIINIPEFILQIYNNRSGQMVTESGEYIFNVQKNSRDIILTTSLSIQGDDLGLRGSNLDVASYDDSQNVQIYFSKNRGESYICTKGNGGFVTYDGMDFKGKNTIEIKAGVMANQSTISVIIGECKEEISLSPAVSFDEGDIYSFKINDASADSLTINIDGNTFISHISLK